MPQLEYLDTDALPAELAGKVFRDLRERRWTVAALVIRYDRQSGRETEQIAFLRRFEGHRGVEWETSLARLYETTVVDT